MTPARLSPTRWRGVNRLYAENAWRCSFRRREVKVGGDDVLRTRRNEDESVQLGLVERSSREGGATGRTTPRTSYSSEDMVATVERGEAVARR